ncbi:related to Serine/threonine-protein kinase SKS1 [Saccharomycodes ludwigii]|uniref:non-specific serine/threonine protein kinase n=1 Tax=Saccharomycodes ludwigii TaxID=36035 RepID=A0A376BAD5_9ASCO|nr:hypothetical protein SCDLUD_001945 [Saccharomycodes ludwigii]KAH3902132.1 hypothetical protein SCDLUD_001945 [Saccharomycodes ludwigii]SSD61645.1 related to Serine/threonine-protein kinase SKS1 [Saccharomycodes ludwigii]
MLNNFQINNFQIIEQIGSGAYGLVFHAIDIITENHYAIKAVLKASSIDKISTQTDVKRSTVLQNQLYHYFKSMENKLFLPCIDLDSILQLTEEQLNSAQYYREIALHLKVHSHKNVVTIHQVLESPIATFIVMDYYPVDLFTSIVDQHHFASDGKLIKKVYLQLCSVINHCHQLGVYHCDIKPENVLLDDLDNIYICDFGLSTTKEYLPSNICVGSSYYMAPERLSLTTIPNNDDNGDSINTSFPAASGDIWSLGVMLINLTCIRNPWLKADKAQDNTFAYFVKDPKVLMKILPVSSSLYKILIQIFKINPYERISIMNLIDEVAECTKFQRSGPLSKVDKLSLDEIRNFVLGDYVLHLKKLLHNYYDQQQQQQQSQGECVYQGDHEGGEEGEEEEEEEEEEDIYDSRSNSAFSTSKNVLLNNTANGTSSSNGVSNNNNITTNDKNINNCYNNVGPTDYYYNYDGSNNVISSVDTTPSISVNEHKPIDRDYINCFFNNISNKNKVIYNNENGNNNISDLNQFKLDYLQFNFSTQTNLSSKSRC